MRILNSLKLDFDDVLIRPKRSKTASRSMVDVNRTYSFLNGTGWRGTPIIAANFDTVGTMEMAAALAKQGMLTCIHKYYKKDELVDFFKNGGISDFVFYTMGISDDDLEKFKSVKDAIGDVEKLRMICIDAANGQTNYFIDRVKKIREMACWATILAGNVATPEMVSELLLSGAADIVKVGIGSGSCCLTRLVAGVGYPQLSAIIECADAAHGLNGHICSDGGCRTPADVVKAFAGGADFVMLGGMLMGHEECSGEWIYERVQMPSEWIGDKVPFRKKALKCYGMSSKEANDKYNGGLSDYRASEGRSIEIPYKGPVINTLQEILGGIRSGCSYCGAKSLKNLSKCTTFIRVTRTHNDVFE